MQLFTLRDCAIEFVSIFHGSLMQSQFQNCPPLVALRPQSLSSGFLPGHHRVKSCASPASGSTCFLFSVKKALKGFLQDQLKYGKEGESALIEFADSDLFPKDYEADRSTLVVLTDQFWQDDKASKEEHTKVEQDFTSDVFTTEELKKAFGNTAHYPTRLLTRDFKTVADEQKLTVYNPQVLHPGKVHKQIYKKCYKSIKHA